MTNYDEFEMNRCTYLYGVRTAKTSFRHWHVCTTCEQPANKRYQTEQIICCAQTLFRPHKHSAFVSAAFTLTRPSACDSSVLTYLRRCDVRVIGSRCFLFISINIFSLSATIASVSFFFFFFLLQTATERAYSHVVNAAFAVFFSSSSMVSFSLCQNKSTDLEPTKDKL